MENMLKEINVITRKDLAGLPIPYKLLINDDFNQSQYEVTRIIRRDNEKIDGQKTTIYTCLVEQNGRITTCDIRFYHDSRKWYLFRML